MKEKKEEGTGKTGGVTRRQLLKSSVTAGILASTGVMALNLTATEANAADKKVLPKKWDETLDTDSRDA